MSGPEMITLGCRLNIGESAAIRQMLDGAGDDVVIVNSCAVTEEAVRQTRRAIRKARRSRPGARLLVTGCAAEIDPQGFGAMPEVDGIVPNARKLTPEAFATFVPAPAIRPNARSAASHARAFVPVQTGCDHRCTFCIIPQGRGPSRSEPAGAVIERIRALVDEGHREVVLTGVDVTSYGELPGDGLGLLVERILRHVPELPRLRLSSLDPVEIDERLFALITGEPRLMPHVHLSLQAGDDLVLKRMRRRHLRRDAVDLVARIKAARPEVAIGADLIAGFPTETEAAFAGTLAILNDCDVVFAHIFPYSPRQGTPAARMPQLETEVIRARARRLRAAAAQRQARWLDTLVGTEQSMLVELDGLTGHAANFAKLRLDAPVARGQLQRVRIVGRDGDTLAAVAA